MSRLLKVTISTSPNLAGQSLRQVVVVALSACLLVGGAGAANSAATETSSVLTSSIPQARTLGAAVPGDVSLMWSWEDEKKGHRVCDDFAARERLGALQFYSVEAATGKKYRGGVSVVGDYANGK